MKLYAGIDLHSNNSYVVILDESDKKIYQKRLPNDLNYILKQLEPFQDSIEGIVIESTYNWYWLVDGLQESGYHVHLANTTAIAQYAGLKYTDDKSDALWLARLLRLGILVEGHIYPKEKRGVRELLRKRLNLVQQQTRCLLSIQSLITRFSGVKITSNKIKNPLEEDKILSFLKDEHARSTAHSQLKILRMLMEQIESLEKTILQELKNNEHFKLLKGMPGVGEILAMTILLETGSIDRFKQVGNYSSYCRCVDSKRLSNGKKKGENNRKNGNQYLHWAFVEAANFAIRHHSAVKSYYQRKLAKTKRVIAIKTVANKLSRACYFVLRDKVKFEMEKAFG